MINIIKRIKLIFTSLSKVFIKSFNDFSTYDRVATMCDYDIISPLPDRDDANTYNSCYSFHEFPHPLIFPVSRIDVEKELSKLSNESKKKCVLDTQPLIW